MPVVAMPRLSDAMEQGTIVRWLVDDGAEVRVGDDLVEIETDKATMTYQAESSGTLRRSEPEGATVRLGEPIATIGDVPATTPAPPTTPPPVTTAAQAAPAAEAPAAAAAAPPPARARAGRRVPASPRARAAASRLGVDLATITGTGPGGRIVSGDVERATATATPAPTPGAVADVHPEDVVVGLSATQRTIARRMVEAKAAPEFVAERDVAVDAVQAERARLRERELPVPSLNDVLVKACALALRQHPRVNASWGDDHIVEHAGVHVGVAVAAPGTLLVPVIRDADRLTLAELARTTRDLATRAREGGLGVAEMRGGTFTVSNLGMMGVDAFTAILNPPQAAILAVGAIREVPAIEDGALVARQVVRLRLTCDHRVLYGADAAAFLQTLTGYVEAPLALA